MGKSSRRRFTEAAAIVAASAPFVASLGRSLDAGTAAAPAPDADATTGRAASPADSAPAMGSSSSSEVPPTGRPLTTAFSCGATWRDARSCGVPCVDGRDDSCPYGQRCYAGIPCEGGESSESFMEEVLERQDRLERLEAGRLRRERDEEYVGRFVCGTSYEEAESSCGGPSSSLSSPRGSTWVDGAEGARYCPAGSSSQCPANMECYASVPCPRRTHAEEPPLVIEIEEASWLSMGFVATEPILLNFTTSEPVNSSGSEGDRTALEDLIGSSPALEGMVSALLSSRRSLN